MVVGCRRRLIWVLLTLIASALVTYGFFPGYMSADSLGQYAQARAGLMSDWHPAVMSWVWRCLDQIWPGPGLMLVFHNLLFWSGLALILTSLQTTEKKKYFLFFCFLIFPPIFGLLSTIWKDIGLGAALTLGLGIGLTGLHKPPLKKILAGPLLMAFIYAGTVRHNALPAYLPLVLGIGFAWSTGSLRWRLWTASACALGMLGVVAAVNHFATNGSRQFPIQQILVHDLVAISLKENQVILPSYLRMVDYHAQLHTIDLSDLKSMYHSENIVFLFCCSDTPHFPMAVQPSQMKELLLLWLQTVPRFFSAYLNHRWVAYTEILSLNQKAVCYPFHQGIDANEWHFEQSNNRVNRFFMRNLGRVKNSFIFRPYTYMFVSLFIFGCALRRRRWISAGVLLSGISYSFAYLFVATTCDFRMHWWTVLATLFGLVLFFNPPRVEKKWI